MCNEEIWYCMNLDDFLQYRDVCPLCNEKLQLVFHSKKRQNIKYEENNILITFPMDSLNKNDKSYKVGFSFNPKNNSFFIEFFTARGEKIEIISSSILKKFLSFNTNLGAYKFYKFCRNCTNYHYESNYFKLNLQALNIGELTVNKERFYMLKPWQDGYKEFELLNDYVTNKSLLGIMNTDVNRRMYNFEHASEPDMLELSLLKFVSKDEMISRIDKLILFS